MLQNVSPYTQLMIDIGSCSKVLKLGEIFFLENSIIPLARQICSEILTVSVKVLLVEHGWLTGNGVTFI